LAWKSNGRVRTLTDRYPGRFTVAEVPGEQPEREMQAFTAGDTHLNSAYGFAYLYAPRLTVDLVRQATQAWDGRPGQGWPSWPFSNHDAPRAVSRWAEGRDIGAVARLAMLLLMCLRGNVFVYQGEELGLPQADVPFDRLVDPEAIANWPKTLGRDGARTPMPWTADAPHAGFSTVEPWLPIDARHLPLAVDRQQSDPAALLPLTQRLIALRKRHPALARGAIRLIPAPDPLLVFERSLDGVSLLCVFNLGHAPMAWTAPPGWRVLEAVNAPGETVLPPLAGQVLSRHDNEGDATPGQG
jgi:alpha-glucosidase